MPGIENGGA
jgi:hypothetical protein